MNLNNSGQSSLVPFDEQKNKVIYFIDTNCNLSYYYLRNDTNHYLGYLLLLLDGKVNIQALELQKEFQYILEHRLEIKKLVLGQTNNQLQHDCIQIATKIHKRLLNDNFFIMKSWIYLPKLEEFIIVYSMPEFNDKQYQKIFELYERLNIMNYTKVSTTDVTGGLFVKSLGHQLENHKQK